MKAGDGGTKGRNEGEGIVEPKARTPILDCAGNGKRVRWTGLKIEHLAYQANDPAAVAQWYATHLGCVVKRSAGPPGHMHFLADSAGSVMVEIYNHPRLETPDYGRMDALLLHLAFCSDDPAADRDRLMAAGATMEEDLTRTPAGDMLVMLRDPWGFAIQLVRRAIPMV